MRRFLCRIGLHKWGRARLVEGGPGNYSNHPWVAIITAMLDPSRIERECKRCGKIKCLK